uniref:Uncharacterized protein n=1 Tax=Parascaris equorum TaxID=6256 RepID=A0A914RSA0_PAREQ
MAIKAAVVPWAHFECIGFAAVLDFAHQTGAEWKVIVRLRRPSIVGWAELLGSPDSLFHIGPLELVG